MRSERTSGATESLWTAGRPVAELAPLRADAEADVCVVGAGIAGLTTAYRLALEGRRVLVLEDGDVGSGETGRTTAHLTAALDDRYELIERLHGEEGTRRAAASHSAAIDRIEQIVAREGIDCGFERVDGYLFLSPEDRREDLEREEAAARRAGLEVRLVERAPVPSFDTGPALLFPRQAQIHPMRYLDGLAEAFRRLGGRLHTGTHATAIDAGPPLRVVTEDGPSVRTNAVVVATNTPVFDRVAIHTKQAAYRSHVVALPVERGAVPAVLLWDTGEGSHRPYPYHYVRIARGGDVSSALPQDAERAIDVLIVGGEDHKTGQAEDAARRWARLEDWARSRFPVRGSALARWSGQVMEPVDALGYVGRDPGRSDEVYVATGDSGNGMTNGTLAGLVLADGIAGRSNDWATLYDPGRVTLRSIGTYARENANVAQRYVDWLRTGDVEAAADVPRGGGAVIVKGLRRLAVHRDAGGDLHVRSAVCPHLGCVVQWNPAETTWDCPCHGSRFDATGRVINGPANRDLRPATLEEHGTEPAAAPTGS